MSKRYEWKSKVSDKSVSKKLGNLYYNAYSKKRWHNIGDYCNRKRHPMSFPYHRYRRGKNRCAYCGGKIGKIRCVYKSSREILVDNIFTETPMLSLLRGKGMVKK